MCLTTARAARVTGPLRVLALLVVVTLLVALPAVLGPPAADADPVPAPTLPEEVHFHEPAVNTVRLTDSHLLLPILAPADEPDRPGRGDRPGGPPDEPPQQSGRPDAGDDRPGRSEVAAAGSVLPATGTPEPAAGLLGALLLAASLAARVPRTPRQR